MVTKIAKTVLLFFTLVIVAALYWLFFSGNSSILKAERTIESNNVSYSVSMKYYIDNAVNPNVAEFYLNSDAAKEKLFLRLLNPSQVKMKLQETALLICHDTKKVYYLSSPQNLNKSGGAQLEIVVLPIGESSLCAGSTDEEIFFKDL